MKLVVMIPAFNEEKTIGTLVKKIPRKITGISRTEVLVIDDGSNDKTSLIAKKSKADRIVKQSINKGLGISFRTGIEEALKMKADIVVNIDADLQFSPKDIPKLIKPILEKKADVVTCSRFLKKEFSPKMPWIKKLGNNIFTWIVKKISRQNLTDSQCGFRAYSKEACLRMNLYSKFTYTQEVLLDLAAKGFRITEVPCIVRGEREFGKSKMVKHWYEYGIRALLIITRFARDYKPLKFFGSIGLGTFLIGVLIGIGLLWRLFLKHKITPFMWLVYIDFALVILGFLIMLMALQSDMVKRQRILEEEILYRIKKQEIDK